MKRNDKVDFQDRTKKIFTEAKIDSASTSSNHNSGIGCVLNENTTPIGTSFPFTNEMVVPSMLSMQQNGVIGGMAAVGHIFSPFRQNRAPIRNQQPTSPGPSSACHVCRVCAKTFRASSLLDIHMRVHVGAKPFVCPICGHRATQKGNLKLHMKKHHGADLPPHIDLVPDSGIWGHPQENVVFSESSQIIDGIDHDASGKRKQVAQAVSSLLNEEVVELIKKYQNEVGQGTTGTITESLEDFIRIAKNKSVGAGEKPPGNQLQKSEEKHEEGGKNRLAFSLRFQPYVNGESAIIPCKPTPHASFSPHSQNCTFCGKSYSTRRNIPQLNLPGFEEILKLPLCDRCVIIQGYMRLMPSYFPNQQPKSLENVAESPPTINNTRSEELEAKKSLNINPRKCEQCTAFLEDSTSLENHRIQCHGIKIDKNGEKSEKEQFLSKVGLVAEDSDENESSSTNHITGLSPIVSHLMNSSRRPLSKSYPDISSLLSRQQKVTLNPVSKKEKSRKRPRSCDLELEINAKRKRASPNVLNMLRQTLLNAADHKASSRQASGGNAKEIPVKGSVVKKEQNADAFSYRNPAMQSLAQIGKSSLHMENEEGFLKRTQQVDFNRNPILSMAYEQDNSGYRCQYCPKWFKYRSVLEIHLRSHTGERPYKCPYCEYAGTQHNCLKLHIQRHHPNKYAIYSAQNSLLPGLRQNFTPDPTANKGSCFSPVNCPICGRVSPSPGYLKIHMRSHKKSLDHVCHICGRGFKEYWYLSTHLKTHERELNSLKFNMHQYKGYSGQQNFSKPVSPVGEMGPKVDRPNPEASFFPSYMGNASRLGVNTKVVKQEPMSTKHLFENYGSVSETALRISPNDSYTKSRLVSNSQFADLNLNDSSITRPRRRKATCPSRVVSSIVPTQVSSTWCKNSVQDSSSLRKMKEQTLAQAMDLSGDLPLDLRCESKKRSDINNNEDMPINLSKM